MRMLVPLLSSLALCASLAACTKGAEETSDGGNRTSESDPSLPTTQTGTPADAEAANGMESGMGAAPAATAPTGTSPAAAPSAMPAVAAPPADATGGVPADAAMQPEGERKSMTPPPLPTE